MAKSKRQRKKIQAQKASLQTGKIKPDVPPEDKVQLSFELYEVGGKFCLSKCNQDEVRQYKDCVRKMTTMTWTQVRETSGKGPNKAGLAYTPYEDSDLKGAKRPPSVSQELRISAVRASQRMRLFGVRIGNAYSILWYDRNHEIVPT